MGLGASRAADGVEYSHPSATPPPRASPAAPSHALTHRTAPRATPFRPAHLRARPPRRHRAHRVAARLLAAAPPPPSTLAPTQPRCSSRSPRSPPPSALPAHAGDHLHDQRHRVRAFADRKRREPTLLPTGAIPAILSSDPSPRYPSLSRLPRLGLRRGCRVAPLLLALHVAHLAALAGIRAQAARGRAVRSLLHLLSADVAGSTSAAHICQSAAHTALTLTEATPIASRPTMLTVLLSCEEAAVTTVPLSHAARGGDSPEPCSSDELPQQTVALEALQQEPSAPPPRMARAAHPSHTLSYLAKLLPLVAHCYCSTPHARGQAGRAQDAAARLRHCARRRATGCLL